MTTFMKIAKSQRRHHEPTALKPSEAYVMAIIRHNEMDNLPDARVSEIAARLRVTSPSVTQIITGLERRGLVQRQRSKADRRVVTVSLTSQGRDEMKRAWQRVLRFNSEITINRKGRHCNPAIKI